MQQRNYRTTLLLILWFSLVAMACNLSNPDSEPPTIEPRKVTPAGNLTPQPTLGLQDPGTNPNPGLGQAGGDGSEQVQVGRQLSQMMNDVQPDRLFSHVEALVNVGTRHILSSQTAPNQGIGAAYRYITDQFQRIQNESAGNFTLIECCWEFEAWSGSTPTQQRNIVGVITGNQAGAGVVVIGAHYDSRTNDLSDGTSPAPGAADNGSGVAVVIELARIMSQYPQRSTIMFVLFSAEEHNRQGSKAFVQNYVVPNNLDLIAMINVDTVGSWNDSQGNINDKQLRVFASGQEGSRQLARMADFLGYNLDLRLDINYVDAIDREGRFGDHFSFDEAGYPSIRFIEALEDHYNREGRDTLDKVEVSYMADATRTILGVVDALSGGLRPPRNIQLRDAGGGNRSLVWEPVQGAKSYIVALRLPGSLYYNQQFAWSSTETDATNLWDSYEGLAIASVDANGMIGPLSQEFKIPR